MDNQDLLTRLILVFLLIVLNAFFVAAEFSLVSVRRTRIIQLMAAGDVPAQRSNLYKEVSIAYFPLPN